MKSLSVKLGVILIGFAIFAHAEVWGEDWVFVYRGGTTDEFICYMDKASITRLPSGDVRVRAKLVQTTEKGVIEMERALELEGKNIRYGHMIGLYEVKCTKRMYNAQSLKAYSKEGTVIRELFEQPSVDVPIESDSFMGKLHKLLCN